MADNISRCGVDMYTASHHDEAALLAGPLGTAGVAHALLAVDDTMRALLALQERQTLALERLAQALECMAPPPASQTPLRAVKWTEGTA